MKSASVSFAYFSLRQIAPRFSRLVVSCISMFPLSKPGRVPGSGSGRRSASRSPTTALLYFPAANSAVMAERKWFPGSPLKDQYRRAHHPRCRCTSERFGWARPAIGRRHTPAIQKTTPFCMIWHDEFSSTKSMGVTHRVPMGFRYRQWKPRGALAVKSGRPRHSHGRGASGRPWGRRSVFPSGPTFVRR